MQIQPYLCFQVRCEEAVEYYKKHLGAKQGRVASYQDARNLRTRVYGVA